MKALKIIGFLAIAFAIAVLFLYKKISPTYLPYLDKNNLIWSSFYSELDIRELNQNYDDFMVKHEYIKMAIENAGGKEVVASGYLAKLKNPVVRIYGVSNHGDALIVSGNLNDQAACLIVNFSRDEKEYSYTPKALVKVHFFVSYLTNECNQKGFVGIERATLKDFLKYHIFRCLGNCVENEGVFFTSDPENKDEYTRILRNKLSQDERAFYQMNRPFDEIEVEITSQIESEIYCYVTFDYNNPMTGRISSHSLFKCQSNNMSLMGIATQDTLSRYFR